MPIRRLENAALIDLWNKLALLQADVKAGHWIWRQEECDALVKVMDAIRDVVVEHDDEGHEKVPQLRIA